MAQPIPSAFLIPANEAVELHNFLLGLPMRDVRVHVQRLETLKPLFEEEKGSPDSGLKDEE